MTNRNINLAVIGCGHWGPNHVRVFQSLPGCRVVAAVDSDMDRLKRIRELYPMVRCEREYRKLLDETDIHAVVVATPTFSHFGIVRDSLDAGKHVLCEKPLCQLRVDADELEHLAASNKQVLMVGHVFLFNAGVMKLKELIANGDVGKPLYLSATRVNLGPIRKDVNVAYDLATHDISIFNWVLNDIPEWVSATGAAFLQPGVEDAVFISMKYPNGVLALVQASWLNPRKVRQITVVGTKKMVCWDDLNAGSPIAIYEKGASIEPDYNDYGEFLRIKMWDGDVKLPKISVEEPLKVQARAFLESITQGTLSRSDARFARGVVAVLESVNASVQQNGHPVRIQQ